MNFTQGGGKGIDEDLPGVEMEAKRVLEWEVPLLPPPQSKAHQDDRLPIKPLKQGPPGPLMLL